MFANRKAIYGVALSLCLLLFLLSSPLVSATAAQEHGAMPLAGASDVAQASASGASASPASLHSPSRAAAAVRLALVNSESVKRASAGTGRAIEQGPHIETIANRFSPVPQQVEVPAVSAAHLTDRDAKVAEAAVSSSSSFSSASSSSSAAAVVEDVGPIITGSVITGLVVVLCFSGVLTVLVLVEIVPHAKRWVRACRGEAEEKTQDELAADRAVELAARERVERALQSHGNGKGKVDEETLGGIESPIGEQP